MKLDVNLTAVGSTIVLGYFLLCGRFELGAGLAWLAPEQITLSADYTGRVFGGQTDHVPKAGLTLDF